MRHPTGIDGRFFNKYQIAESSANFNDVNIDSHMELEIDFFFSKNLLHHNLVCNIVRNANYF